MGIFDGLKIAQKIAEEREGKCNSTEYINSNTPMDWECKFGHKWSAKLNEVKNHNTWCPECNIVWTDEKITILKENYANMSNKNLANMLNLTRKAVRLKAFRLGLTKNHHRQYDINDDFFSNLNNEKTLWLAGFMAADGTIRNDESGRFQIDLARRDEHILYKIKTLTSFEGPIHRVDRTYKIRTNKNQSEKNYASSQLYITSGKMVEDLKDNFNIIPNKSLVLEFPDKIINSSMVNHFIRGYFDGDGWTHIAKSKKCRDQLHLGFIGTEKFLTTCASIIKERAGVDGKIKKHGNVFTLNYRGNKKSAALRNFMYSNSTIFLDRKKDICYLPQFIDIGIMTKEGL